MAYAVHQFFWHFSTWNSSHLCHAPLQTFLGAVERSAQNHLAIAISWGFLNLAMCNLKARHFQAALENSEQALSLDTSCATWKLLSLHEPAVLVGILMGFSTFSPKESIQSQKSPKKQQGSRNTFLYISIVVTVDMIWGNLWLSSLGAPRRRPTIARPKPLRLSGKTWRLWRCGVRRWSTSRRMRWSGANWGLQRLGPRAVGCWSKVAWGKKMGDIVRLTPMESKTGLASDGRDSWYEVKKGQLNVVMYLSDYLQANWCVASKSSHPIPTIYRAVCCCLLHRLAD